MGRRAIAIITTAVMAATTMVVFALPATAQEPPDTVQLVETYRREFMAAIELVRARTVGSELGPHLRVPEPGPGPPGRPVPPAAAPIVTIATPPDGAVYVLGQQVRANYSCQPSSPFVELTMCAGPVPSGAFIFTGTVGVKTFSVVAEDTAGNRTVETHTYEVVRPVG
jgi:hypothetical protein